MVPGSLQGITNNKPQQKFLINLTLERWNGFAIYIFFQGFIQAILMSGTEIHGIDEKKYCV